MAKAPKADDPNEGVYYASPVEVRKVGERPDYTLYKCRGCGLRRSRYGWTELPPEGTHWRSRCYLCTLHAKENLARMGRNEDAYQRAILRNQRRDEEEALAKDERENP